MAALPFNVLSLCSGYGGLDLAVAGAIRGARTVCYVEREVYAAAILATRMADGGLDPAPVWSDLSTFDGRRWRGVVDLVVAGFPCQDISVAGKGAGIGGKRSGLWKQVLRVLGECGAEYVFLENVSALVRRGLDVVLADLAALGFDAEWGCYTAAEVGAPHRRDRIFILAERQIARLEGGGKDCLDSAAISHAECFALRKQRRWSDGARGQAASIARPSGALGDVTVARQGTVFPPGPDDFVGWERFLLDWPDAEPAVRRDAHGLACRVDRLRALGNGVVPQQAALAFAELRSRFE